MCKLTGCYYFFLFLRRKSKCTKKILFRILLRKWYMPVLFSFSPLPSKQASTGVAACGKGKGLTFFGSC